MQGRTGKLRKPRGVGCPLVTAVVTSVLLAAWTVVLILGQHGCKDSAVLLQPHASDSNSKPCDTGSTNVPHLQPARRKELVLVTGGAGFVGSHLVELLLKLGYHVLVLDNLSTGSRTHLDGSQPALEFMFGDITRYQDCLKAMQGSVVGVFHLAALTQQLPPSTTSASQQYMEVNVGGTQHVLQAALVTGGIQKIVYAASSTAYGSRPGHLMEGMPPDPQTLYASSKLSGEYLMKQFDSAYNLSTLTLRLFPAYGARQPSTGPYSVEHMVKDNCSWDLTHVSDIARAMVLGFQSSAHGVVINIGTGRGTAPAALLSGHRGAAAAPIPFPCSLANTCLASQKLGFHVEMDSTPFKTQQALGSVNTMQYILPVVDAEMVIAQGRNEDLSWVNDTHLPLMRQFIYDRRDFTSAESIPVNMGGEAVPYLYHIIKQYDKLPTVVIFSQGDPVYHIGSMQRFSCLVKFALRRSPDYAGFSANTFVEHDFAGNYDINKYADEMLATLGVARREPNVGEYNAIFATTRVAIHRHPKDWWILMWDHLTDAYNHPDSLGSGGGSGSEHLIERYWVHFLDPEGTWEKQLKHEHDCPVCRQPGAHMHAQCD